MKKFILPLLFVIFVLGSCTKYDEGNNFSIIPAKARLVNHWVITEYTVNGTTQAINSTNTITLDMNKDNSYKRTITLFGFAVTDSGKWAFADGKNSVILTKSTGEVETYTIIQLKNKDLKAKRIDGSTTYQYTFKGN